MQATNAVNLIMPNRIPKAHWLQQMHVTREYSSRLLFSERNFLDAHEGFDAICKDGISYDREDYTRSEKRLEEFWHRVLLIASAVKLPKVPSQNLVRENNFEIFIGMLDDLRLVLEKLRMPGATTLSLEDEPTMFHENMLIACYSYMELLRASHKIVEQIRLLVFPAKSNHRLKKELPPKYDVRLLEATQICFQAVRDVAQSYVDLILRRGVQAIKAQVRWGPTGKALKAYLPDEDVEYYAQEYVESAVEAWRGVLKVKLK